MDKSLDNIAGFTRYLLCEYYRLNAKPLFSVLSDDAMWIGPGNLFVFGAAAIKSYFKNGWIMPPMTMQDEEFYSLGGSDKLRTVVGQYVLTSDHSSEMVCAERQRITFQYRVEKDRVSLCHMHVSNEWSALEGDEIFPVKMSTQTYQYVQMLLSESGRHGERTKVVLRTESTTLFIDPDMVMYVEAIGASSIIHYIDKGITVKKILGELVPLFPEYFYRAHRSFLVNCNYISEIERYSLTLITGEKIPVPEKRYTSVRDDITAIMERKHKI